jgi:hypothetical protein
MNFRRGPVLSGPVFPPERKAGVFDEKRFEPQIPRHANRSLNRIIGNHPADHYHVPLRCSQTRLQIGANECAVRSLNDDGLPSQRRALRLELVPDLTRLIVRFRLRRIVAHMVNRSPRTPPRLKQRGNVPLRIRVIPLTPTRIAIAFCISMTISAAFRSKGKGSTPGISSSTGSGTQPLFRQIFRHDSLENPPVVAPERPLELSRCGALSREGLRSRELTVGRQKGPPSFPERLCELLVGAAEFLKSAFDLSP